MPNNDWNALKHQIKQYNCVTQWWPTLQRALHRWGCKQMSGTPIWENKIVGTLFKTQNKPFQSIIGNYRELIPFYHFYLYLLSPQQNNAAYLNLIFCVSRISRSRYEWVISSNLCHSIIINSSILINIWLFWSGADFKS